MTSEPKAFARVLRARQTRTEEALWHQLRGRRLRGHKFRRQVPLAGYVVDFFCFDAKLIIEIDGAHHAGQTGYDAARSHDLEAMGFQVIRFSNAEIETDLDRVLDLIATALGEAA